MPKGIYKRKDGWVSPTSFKKGHIPWSKGKKGVWEISIESRLKRSSRMLGRVSPTKGMKWGKGKLFCSNGCGKQLANYGSKMCKPCRGKVYRGENSFCWLDDRSKLQKYGDTNKDRRSSAYNSWRKEVWARDNHKCKIDNRDCKGRIEAHHILSYTKFPELRYNVNNGITLCHTHHPRKGEEAKRLSPYFKELVTEAKEQI